MQRGAACTAAASFLGCSACGERLGAGSSARRSAGLAGCSGCLLLWRGAGSRPCLLGPCQPQVNLRSAAADQQGLSTARSLPAGRAVNQLPAVGTSDFMDRKNAGSLKSFALHWGRSATGWHCPGPGLGLPIRAHPAAAAHRRRQPWEHPRGCRGGAAREQQVCVCSILQRGHEGAGSSPGAR